MASFSAELLQAGKTATGIEVPPAVLEDLGGSKRPKVAVTINGFTFSLTLGSMGGKVMIPVSAERRAGAGIAGGDQLDVEIVLDAAPQVIEVPDDLAAALGAAGARAAFDALAPSHRKEHVRAITEAKKPETRERRIAKCIDMVSS